jgi:hypothetical protein
LRRCRPPGEPNPVQPRRGSLFSESRQASPPSTAVDAVEPSSGPPPLSVAGPA